MRQFLSLGAVIGPSAEGLLHLVHLAATQTWFQPGCADSLGAEVLTLAELPEPWPLTG